ncbi:MAG: hypothetical protein HOV81_32050 [Kofleriaceae bacterium]|nr:hypothetical protein [Kofleriaceae bacterium]
MGTSTPIDVTINGQLVKTEDLMGMTVDRDMGSPDMATIVLSNPSATYSTTAIATPIEIKVGDDKVSVYKGEVVGVEAIYKGMEKPRIVLRAMNKLHRLLRKRKSLTFTDKTDQQILSQVVSDGGLTLDWKHEKSITYKHVYQHNLSGLEFLRMRAARMGCHVWCVDTKVYVKQPELQGSPVAEYHCNDTGKDTAVRVFHPRISSTSVVNKVTVKGWNPETKELITGEATVSGSRLGSQTSVAGSGDLGNAETFTVDHPIWSKEEAVALAKARLTDLSLSYMTGECEVYGDPKVDLGKLIKVTANEKESNASSDPFNGNYYVMGVTHRYTTQKKDGGYFTVIRFARDAQKQ